jgi:hypothetical protein
MTSKNYSILAAMLALSATAIVASCSTANVGVSSFPGEDGAEASAQGQNVDTQTESEEASNGLEQSAVAQSPQVPKDASDWIEFIPDIELDIDEFIDWGVIFDGMHQSVAAGDNELDIQDYMYKSDDVYNDTKIVGFGGWPPTPILGPVVCMDAYPNLSFITYGLKDIPAGKQVNSIQVEGWNSLGYETEVYIGLSDMGNAAYEWYGPYEISETGSVLANMPILDNNVSAEGRSYITLALYNHDAVNIDGVSVEIGDPIDLGIEIPEWELPELGF